MSWHVAYVGQPFLFPGNRRPRKLRPCILPSNAAHRLLMMTRCIRSSIAVKNGLQSQVTIVQLRLKARVNMPPQAIQGEKNSSPRKGDNSRIFSKLPIRHHGVTPCQRQNSNHWQDCGRNRILRGRDVRVIESSAPLLTNSAGIRPRRKEAATNRWLCTVSRCCI